MDVREPPCPRQGPDDGSPTLPDGASTSVAQTFRFPRDDPGAHSGDTLRSTTNSTKADLRPRIGLSSLADIESALPSATPAGSRRTRPTGLAIAAASPPVCIDEIPSSFLSAEGGASPETVEERAADLDHREVRSRTTRSKGPSSAPRRSGVCKFFNAQKVCLGVYSRGRGDGSSLSRRVSGLSSTTLRKSSVMSKVRIHTLPLRSRTTSVNELTQDRAVFVHYTTIPSVKGGPNGFKSLLEVRRILPRALTRVSYADQLLTCTGCVSYRRNIGRTCTDRGLSESAQT